MTDRFSPLALFKAHFVGLKDHSKEKGVDRFAATALVIAPLGAAVAMGLFGTIKDAAAWFTGISLISTGLVALFVYLAELRMRLAARAPQFPLGDKTLRENLDEAGTHALAGAYLGVVSAAVLVIEMNLASELRGLYAAVPTWSSVYTLMIALMLVPRIHHAFSKANEVLDRG